MGRISARVFLLETLLFALVLLIFPSHVSASIFACSATVSPNSIGLNTMGNSVIFQVTNNDTSGNNMVYILVQPPPGDFTTEGNTFFTGFSAVPGDFIVESVTVDAGGTVTSSPQNWTVQVADNSDGIGVTTCTGDLGMSIVDTNPPQISNVVVSDISNVSAVISWTTNKPATSELDYGQDSSYGSVKSDSNSATNHSYTLDSLSANTTYHFDIKATDDMGTSDLGDNSFITAETASVTLAPQTITVTKTTTTTQLVTPSPTPTPVPDTTPPSIYLTTKFSKPFAQSPQISGTVTDNKAVAKVEYSLDGGHNWLPVDSAPGLGKASTSFSFLPPPLDDGNYPVQIRGIDSSNNTGTSKIYTMVIDRLPPQVSGVMFSLGPQIINPGSDGSLVVLAGQLLKINLSEVGGTTGMVVSAKELSGKVKTFNLDKNTQSGLWSANLSLDQGTYQLSFSAVDGAGNRTERNLNKIIAVSKGKISDQKSMGVLNAKITVYYQEPITNTWQVWDGGAYSQNNPQLTDANGNYGLFLPQGRYYLHIEGFGFKTLDTQFFTINNPQPINASFKLSPLKLLFALGPFKLYLPDFSVLSVPFVNNLPSVSQNVSSLVGKNTPFFNLNISGQDQLNSDNLTGKPTVVTFLNTWSPESTEQISVLNNFAKNNDFNSTVIVEGEKVSQVYVFQKRGNYGLPIFADPDATLSTSYNLSVLPVHYFLDKSGVVKKVMYGALNENELANTLINISQ